MFEPLEKTRNTPLHFVFDGQDIACAPGDSIASALLAAGVKVFRETPVSGAPRAPFCMMGACYDCLVSINGKTVQACMTPAEDGLLVERAHQNQPGEVA
jgi:predicted molibdopterin-dependent oxidoreductase YjgC